MSKRTSSLLKSWIISTTHSLIESRWKTHTSQKFLQTTQALKLKPTGFICKIQWPVSRATGGMPLASWSLLSKQARSCWIPQKKMPSMKTRWPISVETHSWSSAWSSRMWLPIQVRWSNLNSTSRLSSSLRSSSVLRGSRASETLWAW